MTIAMPKETNVEFRWMSRSDMDAVCRIEYECFDFPWFLEDFLACLRQRNCIAYVAVYDREVVGFELYELQKNRLELLKLAVAPQWQRRSIGGRLIQRLVSRLSPGHRRELVALVSEANYGGQKFLQAMGFKATGVVRGHFERNREDAYRMVYTLETEQ